MRIDKILPGLEGSNEVLSMDYHAESKQLVAAYSNNTVVVWDTLSGDIVKTLESDKKSVEVKFSPDGSKVLGIEDYATNRSRIWVWSLETDLVVKRLLSTNQYSNSIGWTSDSERVLYNVVNKIEIRKVRETETALFLDAENTITVPNSPRVHFEMCSEDRILAYTKFYGGYPDSHARLMETNGTVIREIDVQGDKKYDNVKVSPSGDRAVIALRSANGWDRFSLIYDIDADEVERYLETDAYSPIRWSPLETKISLEGEIWSSVGVKLGEVKSAYYGRPNHLEWLEENVVAYTPYRGAGVRKADIRIQTLPEEMLFDDHLGEVVDVKWFSDGERGLSLGEDNVIKIWTPDGEVTDSITEALGDITAIATSRDSYEFAFYDGEKIQLWDYSEDKKYGAYSVKDITVPNIIEHMIMFKNYLVASDDDNIYVYDTTNSQLVDTVQNVKVKQLEIVGNLDRYAYIDDTKLVITDMTEGVVESYEDLEPETKIKPSAIGDKIALFKGTKLDVRMLDSNLTVIREETFESEIKGIAWSVGDNYLTVSLASGTTLVYRTDLWLVDRTYEDLVDNTDFLQAVQGGLFIVQGPPKNAVRLEGVTYNEGSGSRENPYVIENFEGLLKIRQDHQASYKLDNDIDMVSWHLFGPIEYGVDEEGNIIGFEGTLDGNGHTLRGLQKNGMFFCVQNGGEIRNLILEDVNTDLPALFEMSFAGTVKIENCHVQGSTKEGGFAVQVTNSDVTFKDCTFTGTVTDGSGIIEGYYGDPAGSPRLVVENCHVKADITDGCGIVGQAYGPNIIIKDSSFEGNITNGSGVLDYGNNNLLIENCHVKADIMSSKNAAGILSQVYEDGVVIKDCTFEGSITSTRQRGISVGGIADYARCDIYNCHVKADIINPEGKSAGIGNQNYAGPVVHTIEGCTFEGTIEGRGAGISLRHEGIIRNCKVNASIGIRNNDNYDPIAGIVGETYNSEGIVEDCVFEGTLIGDGVAGLAENLGGTMRRCLFRGEIINTQARYNPSASGMIGFLYETGKLHESGFFGTIIDETEDPDTLLVGAVKEAVGEIKNVLVRGHIESPEGKVSGLFGMAYMLDNFENIYFEGTLEGAETFGAVQRIGDPPDQTTNSIYYSADAEDLYAIKKTLEELKDETTFFSTWDFENIWVIDERVNDGFPMLRSLLKKGELDPPPARRPRLVVSGGPDVGVYVVQVPK